MRVTSVIVISVSVMMVGAFAPDSNSRQIGLDCTGTNVDGVQHTTTPYRARMSVDLDRQEFCYLPDCSGLYELGHVTDAEIRLFDHPFASNYLVGTVDRNSGAFELVMQSRLANNHVTGSCIWTAFTPFAVDAKRELSPRPVPGDGVVAAPPLPLP